MTNPIVMALVVGLCIGATGAALIDKYMFDAYLNTITTECPPCDED